MSTDLGFDLSGGDPLAAARDFLASARSQQASATVEGTAGGGTVRVTMTAERRVTGLTIDPTAYAELEREELEALVVAACGEAFARAQAASLAALGGLASLLSPASEEK